MMKASSHRQNEQLPTTSILWRRFPVEDVKRWIVDDAETSAQTPSKTPKAKRTVSYLPLCMLYASDEATLQ